MIEKHNILFLDFDWVINSHEYFESEYYQERKKKLKWITFWKYKFSPSLFDDRLIENVNSLIKECNFKIVLSTSYRLWETVEGCKELCKKIGIVWDCIWKTSVFSHDLFHKDQINPDGCTRGVEIQDYLESNGDYIERYLILDDDNDLLSTQNYYLTDGEKGFTKKDLNKAIVFFNNLYKNRNK